MLRKPPVSLCFWSNYSDSGFRANAQKSFCFLMQVKKMHAGESQQSMQNMVRKEQVSLCKWKSYADLDKVIKPCTIMLHSKLIFSSKQNLRKTPEKCAKCQRRSEIWAQLNVTFKPIYFLWCRLINPININEKRVVPTCKPWAEIPYCPSKISLHDSNIELLHLKCILTCKVSKFYVYFFLNKNK